MQLFSMDFTDIEGTINRSRCLEAYLNMGNDSWEQIVKVVAEYFHVP